MLSLEHCVRHDILLEMLHMHNASPSMQPTSSFVSSVHTFGVFPFVTRSLHRHSHSHRMVIPTGHASGNALYKLFMQI